MDKATKALKGYGFVEMGSLGWVKTAARTERAKTRYVALEGGGFHRFEWEDGTWRQYPFTLLPDYEGVAGLAFDAKLAAHDPNAKIKPDWYDWVHPSDWVATEYANPPVPSK